jgi:PAS domain S-box-containing protein
MEAKSKHTKILILDDDEEDFQLTADYIHSIAGSSFITDWCFRYDEGIKHYTQGNYHLYFIDYRLGAKTGLDFLKDTFHLPNDFPVILLTGKGNINIDIQSMQFGAMDYLVKTELSVEKMERCIRYAMERAASQRALKANEKKYRNIFERSKDVIFIADKDLTVIDVNPAVGELLGIEKNNAKGANLFQFFFGSAEKKLLQSAIASGTPVTDREVIFRTADGAMKYCLLSLSYQDEKAAPVQGIIHDISSIKKMERITVQNEKIAATKRLVRTVAHEVRNPLNNITLATGSLRQLSTETDAAVFLDIIMRNADRIEKLIKDLLHTSAPVGNLKTPVLLSEIIEEVLQTSADKIILKNIELIKIHEFNPEQPVAADPSNLKLALLNIVNNAIDAMTAGQGVLTVAMLQQHTETVVTVSDNGAGIRAEDIDHIFEPYFTQKPNGLGLGLTFTLNILQDHGARVEVKSELGKGTSFIITFLNTN